MSTNVSKLASPTKAWNLGLWGAQVLLAVMFGMSGLMKSTQPLEALAANLPWVTDLPSLTRFIGVTQVLAAIGLILPAATRILPVLTPAAAGGLLTTMVLAAGFHATRGEFSGIPINVVLGLFAALVLWGRLRKSPIAPRR